MATQIIRSTYALDVETMQALERLARRWNVSKSEALRRAIRAAEGVPPDSASARLQAFERLQQALRLTPATARAWSQDATRARRAWSTRSETRGR
jgi:hypothetical protein